MGRYSKNSRRGETLARVLFMARQSRRRNAASLDDGPPLRKLSQRLMQEAIAKLVDAYVAGATTT